MDSEKLQKSRNFWLATSMLLMGVAVGYLIAPAKNGIHIKNICGNGWAADDCVKADGDPDLTECADDEDLKF